MHTTIMVTAGLAAALLAITASQLPNAALGPRSTARAAKQVQSATELAKEEDWQELETVPTEPFQGEDPIPSEPIQALARPSQSGESMLRLL
jgi:hypothetical protein